MNKRVLVVEEYHRVSQTYEIVIPDYVWDLVLASHNGNEELAKLDIEQWSRDGDWIYHCDPVSEYTNGSGSGSRSVELMVPDKNASPMPVRREDLAPDYFGDFGEANYYAFEIYLMKAQEFGVATAPFRLEDVLGFGLDWSEDESDKWFRLTDAEKTLKYLTWKYGNAEK